MTDWRATMESSRPGDFGIIGDPVDHSLSPAMQGPALDRWWRLSGQPAATAPAYRMFHVPPAEVPDALEEIRRRKLMGVNVTVPHKTAVVPRLDRLDSFAKGVGAVNTIKLEVDELAGFNTDGVGFARTLSQDMKLKPKVALVLGAGGTAQVIVHQLLALDVEKIYWWNRTVERLRPLLKSLVRKGSDVETVADAGSVREACAASDLVVNATTVGLKEGDGLPADDLEFRAGLSAFDVIYNHETAFLSQARAAGALVCGGLPMLLHQGAAAFEIWTGETAPVDLMKDSLMKAVQEKGIKPVWPSAI
jgi:shikimate dehydrogenase